MLGLSANLNYYLFNGNVDLRKGIFRPGLTHYLTN